MDVNCVNGEIVVTHSSGFVSTYNRNHYEDVIEQEREMLKAVQSNIDKAEKMIELIDFGSTSKVTE